MKTAKTSLRVRYGEVDRMGFVYYAAYLPWMVATAGGFYPQTSHPHAMYVSYRSPARYDDLLRVSAVDSVEGNGLVLVRVLREDDLLVEGKLYYGRSKIWEQPQGLLYGNSWRTTIEPRIHEVQSWGLAAITALTWFEASRNEHLRGVGLTYAECERRGIWLPVVSAWVNLVGTVKVGEGLTVESRAVKQGVRVGFTNRIDNINGDVVAQGGTLHVCTTPEGKILKPLPELTSLLELGK